MADQTEASNLWHNIFEQFKYDLAGVMTSYADIKVY